jgi:hypothetical protein
MAGRGRAPDLPGRRGRCGARLRDGWPEAWGWHGLSSERLAGRRDRQAPQIGTRGQRRPFERVAPRYQTCAQAPRVAARAAGTAGDVVWATAGGDQHARFGDHIGNGHDALPTTVRWGKAWRQPGHREPGHRELDLDIFISGATVLTIITAAGHCTGIYVVSMDGEIGGGNEVSEVDVVTAAGAANGKAAQVADPSDRCGGTMFGQTAEMGGNARRSAWTGRGCGCSAIDLFPPETAGSAPKRPLRRGTAYGAS